MFLKVLLFVTLTAVPFFGAQAAKTVLIPLPTYGFDPTESAVPWKSLKNAGYNVVFATPRGDVGATDIRMLEGKDLGFWKPILMADKNARADYAEMSQSQEFQHPISYNQINASDYDGLILVGGHDKGVKEFLESSVLKAVVLYFFENNKPVGAICHGTLLAARTVVPETGKSVLYGRKTTALTKMQELTPYAMTHLSLGDYYLTYPETTVQDEVNSYLKSTKDFVKGPGVAAPIKRDSPENLNLGFVVHDGNYISARWPGDAHRFGSEFLKLLK